MLNSFIYYSAYPVSNAILMKPFLLFNMILYVPGRHSYASEAPPTMRTTALGWDLSSNKCNIPSFDAAHNPWYQNMFKCKACGKTVLWFDQIKCNKPYDYQYQVVIFNSQFI